MSEIISTYFWQAINQSPVGVQYTQLQQMIAQLAELELLQFQLLNRLSALERSLLTRNDAVRPSTQPNDTVSRLSAILQSNGVTNFEFKRVPSDYYHWPLDSRRHVLNAASIDHLCKSIVLVLNRNFTLSFIAK